MDTPAIKSLRLASASASLGPTTSQWLAMLDQATRKPTGGEASPSAQAWIPPNRLELPDVSTSNLARPGTDANQAENSAALSASRTPPSEMLAASSGAASLSTAEIQDKLLISRFGGLAAAVSSDAAAILSHLARRLGAVPSGLRMDELIALDHSLAKLAALGPNALETTERSALYLTPGSAKAAQDQGIELPTDTSWREQQERVRQQGSTIYAGIDQGSASPDPAGMDERIPQLARDVSRDHLISTLSAEERSSFDAAVAASARADAKLGASIGLATVGLGLPAVATALSGAGAKIGAWRQEDALLAQAQARDDAEASSTPTPPAP